MNAEMIKESQEAIEELLRHKLINDDMAVILTRDNVKDPDKARWIIATLANHTINPASGQKMVAGLLSEDDFARICMLGVYRYHASQGNIHSAAEKVQAFTDTVATYESARDPTKGCFYVLQYLSRTTAEVGRACAVEVQAWKESSGKDLNDLSVDEWYILRHRAEKSSLTDPKRMSLSHAAFAAAAKGGNLLVLMTPPPQETLNIRWSTETLSR